MGTAAMSWGLQRRLLALLLIPLALLASVNAWLDYRIAAESATQQDPQLLKLIPLMADSVIANGVAPTDPPIMLMAPAIQEFLKGRSGMSAFSIADLDGRVLVGDAWLRPALSISNEPEFSSEQENGIAYRIVSQRMTTAAGDLVVSLADGSDPRQQWADLLLLKVIFPNLLLLLVVAMVANWAIRKALRPLLELKNAVENRSPSDLSPLGVETSPEEVRPLVQSLNRLFHLVNTQAEGQRRFVADAAHQLRTPLAGLQAQAEAWAQAVNKPARTAARNQDYAVKPFSPGLSVGDNVICLDASQINGLRDATRRTTQLANQLLALSRADASGLEVRSAQRIDLKNLCETLLEAHLDAAAVKSIDLGIDAQIVHVTGHEWLLRELLANLLDNALKYTQPGGAVTLRCARTIVGGVPFIEVDDNGPGIPLDERSRVFGRFYRLPGSPLEGNGLGLAIADEIARAHQSQLTLASGPGGVGTRVTMLFVA